MQVRCKNCRFGPWMNAQQSTPVFLPGESHGHRSLVVYSPQVHKSQTWLKWLSTHTRTMLAWKRGDSPGKIAFALKTKVVRRNWWKMLWELIFKNRATCVKPCGEKACFVWRLKRRSMSLKLWKLRLSWYEMRLKQYLRPRPCWAIWTILIVP